MTTPTEKQLASLPKWASRHIESLEQHIRTLKYKAVETEMMHPWTEPGMDWFTLFGQKHEEVTIFTCSEAGTNRLVTLGENDRLFVGRSKMRWYGEDPR